MFTPLDFESLIPVNPTWKEKLAKQLMLAAAARERSYNKAKGTFGGYALSIPEAAEKACEPAFVDIVARCLRMCWNESMDFCGLHHITPDWE